MKTNNKFIGLDHLRALAISLVFLYHYSFYQHPAWFENFAGFGWCGVDLFFVLSGFLISNQLFEEWQKNLKISLGTFYLKRAFRILPPYFFVLLIYIFVPAFHEREKLAPLWKMFSFTQNYGQNIRIYGTFSHAWSLCVEEQFYLLLPLLMILIFTSRFKRKSAWMIPAIFIFSLLARLIVWQCLKSIQDTDDFGMYWYRWIYYPTFTRFDGLITGVGIAAVYRFRGRLFVTYQKYANLLLLAGCLLFTLAFFFCRDQFSFGASVFGFSLIAITFGFFVVSAILPGSFLFRSKSFLTRNLAALSYSLYLSHKGLIHLTQKLLTGSAVAGNSALMFLICLVVCIAGAWLMRILIEKPFFRLRNQVLLRNDQGGNGIKTSK
jgi:peptidoglycan/LPS O-acetylase OafA/YrhL